MINYNLIKCAFGMHKFGEPIRNETLNRLERYCKHCSSIDVISAGTFTGLEATKKDIIKDIDDDKFNHAKRKLDNVIKELGYWLQKFINNKVVVAVLWNVNYVHQW